jgi:hypothetical protein
LLIGFEDGLDRLDLRGYVGAMFANAAIAQQGANTLVTLPGGEKILPSSSPAADFLFGP